MDAYGRLDGALISVGGPPASKVQETTEEIWRGAFDSVFLAGLRVSNAVLRAGTASDLAIVWVLSTSVKSPVPNLAASNGLRPGLAVLIKQLADEVGPGGTRVVGLMPGRIETERVLHLDSLAEDPAAARAAGEAATALRRSGTPTGVRAGGGLRAVSCRVLPHRLRHPRRGRCTASAVDLGILGELGGIELGVEAALGEQLRVSSARHDPAVVDDHNQVRVAHG